MKKMRWLWLLLSWMLLSFLTVQACTPPSNSEPQQEQVVQDAGKEPTQEPATEPDKEPVQDTTDAASADQKEPVQDASVPEEPTVEVNPEPVQETKPDGTGVPKPGVGKITGDCGVLDDTEWKSKSAFLFTNNIDFGTTGFDKDKDGNLLTKGGQKILKDGNLGGSSVLSEIFAFELLFRCELASLVKSETEIQYKDKNGKKTDMLVKIDGYSIGVSVTRAYQYPPGKPYTLSAATSLLEKKLKALPQSQANAAASNPWTRSLLFILAFNKQHADTISQAWNKLTAGVRGNAIVIVSITDGKDTFLY